MHEQKLKMFFACGALLTPHALTEEPMVRLHVSVDVPVSVDVDCYIDYDIMDHSNNHYDRYDRYIDRYDRYIDSYDRCCSLRVPVFRVPARLGTSVFWCSVFRVVWEPPCSGVPCSGDPFRNTGRSQITNHAVS